MSTFAKREFTVSDALKMSQDIRILECLNFGICILLARTSGVSVLDLLAEIAGK